MKRRVYVETSVISYLANRPSRDVIVAGRQQLTQAWWERRRPAFELVISQIVLDEAGAGDLEAARRRLAFVEGLPLLDVTAEVAELATLLIERVGLPPQAAADAAHVAARRFTASSSWSRGTSRTSRTPRYVVGSRTCAGIRDIARRFCALRMN